MSTEYIVKFLQTAYSDEKLAALLAHAQDGKLEFYSCCCIGGFVTADHAAQGMRMDYNEVAHYLEAMLLPFAREAEKEFCALGYDGSRGIINHSGLRREKIIPLIIAEQERREQLRLEDIEAEREGELTEASGYPDPVYERNGR